MKTASTLIVLNHVKYGESSIVLHALTQRWGRRSFLVKLGKKTSMGFFQPLNILECSVFENPRSQLWSATQFSLPRPLLSTRGSLHKNTMTLFLSEVLYRTIKEGDGEDLWDWCEGAVLALDSLEGDFSNFHLRFLLELCIQLGFSPSLESLTPFVGEDREKIRSFLELPFAQSMLLPMTGEERNRICEEFLSYLQFHTESRITIKSLPILRELYR